MTNTHTHTHTKETHTHTDPHLGSIFPTPLEQPQPPERAGWEVKLRGQFHCFLDRRKLGVEMDLFIPDFLHPSAGLSEKIREGCLRAPRHQIRADRDSAYPKRGLGDRGHITSPPASNLSLAFGVQPVKEGAHVFMAPFVSSCPPAPNLRGVRSPGAPALLGGLAALTGVLWLGCVSPYSFSGLLKGLIEV